MNITSKMLRMLHCGKSTPLSLRQAGRELVGDAVCGR